MFERKVNIWIRAKNFQLPPVESALVIGRRALIGPKAMIKALHEMVPDQFEMIAVEHPLVEAVLVRRAHLRRVDGGELVDLIVRNVAPLMDASETLHVALDIEVSLVDTL